MSCDRKGRKVQYSTLFEFVSHLEPGQFKTTCSNIHPAEFEIQSQILKYQLSAPRYYRVIDHKKGGKGDSNLPIYRYLYPSKADIHGFIGLGFQYFDSIILKLYMAQCTCIPIACYLHVHYSSTSNLPKIPYLPTKKYIGYYCTNARGSRVVVGGYM